MGKKFSNGPKLSNKSFDENVKVFEGSVLNQKGFQTNLAHPLAKTKTLPQCWATSYTDVVSSLEMKV